MVNMIIPMLILLRVDPPPDMLEQRSIIGATTIFLFLLISLIRPKPEVDRNDGIF